MNDSLSEMFANSFSKMIESGDAQKIIDKHVSKCFDEVVCSSVSYNSPFKKQLEEDFKSKFGYIPEKANMAVYSEIISNKIADQFTKLVAEGHADTAVSSIIKKLQADSRPEQSSYDLEEFLREACEHGDPNQEDDEWDECKWGITHMSFHIQETSGGYKWLSFDFEKGLEESYAMKYRIGLCNESRIFSVNLGKAGMDDVTKFLIKCKFAQTKIDLEGAESDDHYEVKYKIEE